jgi:hypothetical protein
MHFILLVALLATAARPATPPPRAARERTGMRLGPRDVLKLQVGAGLVLDTNPNNTPAAEHLRLARRQSTLNVSSPGLGISVNPAIQWKHTRRSVLVDVNASARAWMLGYVGNGMPPKLGNVALLPEGGDYFPQVRAGLDLNLDGTLTLNLTRNQQLISLLRILRTTVPSPELLGTPLGRTTFSSGLGWALSNRRRTWTFTLQSGARADVMDNLTVESGTWRTPRISKAPPLYLGGLGLSLGGTLEHTLRRWGGVYLRAQGGGSVYLDPVSVLSISAPVSAVAGWHLEHPSGVGLRAEAGLWLPNSLCPQSVMKSCPGRPAEVHFNGAPSPWQAAPIPVALLQWDQALGRRLLLTLRASKDARTTLLYAFVDEKRVEASLTAQAFPTLVLRVSSAVAWYSYGAPVVASFTRTEFDVVEGTMAARLVDVAGRQDLAASGDVSLRWAVRPWLVFSLQQTVMAVVPSVQVQRSDGIWENPGLLRAVSSGLLTWQW